MTKQDLIAEIMLIFSSYEKNEGSLDLLRDMIISKIKRSGVII